MPTPKSNVEILRVQIAQRKANIIDLERQSRFEKDSLRRLEKMLEIRLAERVIKEREPTRWVYTEKLSFYILRWMAEDPAHHTMRTLAERSGMSDKHLRNIRDPITHKTSERVADKVMTALGLTHLFGNELEIFQVGKPYQHYEEE